ncbi:helix-turn-helix transcriptional regulator [Rummeliibacillus suwonensis]|uniref:helix-turn-helix transcriptional regulator n=1 Tax=Rummeliibacillus suwonensis TaxID=1306154 RepID=UPI0028976BF9|nr:helix-turn-helix transcriptional regulator [Rummeliibacillus suwonensis]
MTVNKIPQISLKAARVNANLTLAQAAKNLEISVSTLIKWEKNPGNLTPNQQLKLSKVYEFPSDFIFFGNELELKSS